MGSTPCARLITDAALPLCGDAEKIHAVFSLCNILKKLKIVDKNIFFFIQTQELLNTVYLKHIRILHFILSNVYITGYQKLFDRRLSATCSKICWRKLFIM